MTTTTAQAITEKYNVCMIVKGRRVLVRKDGWVYETSSHRAAHETAREVMLADGYTTMVVPA